MRKRTSAEDFIKAWQASNSTKEVAKKLGIKDSAIQSRASLFRKHGVPLKKFKRAGSNWEELTQLAKSLLK